MISQDKIDEILKSSKNEEVIGDFETLKKSGSSLICKCPNCNANGKGKGLLISPFKGIYKCFSCDFSGNNPIKYLCEIQKMKYPDALKYLADKYYIIIEEIKKGPQKKEKVNTNTFRDLQLSQSGLNDADQKATVFSDDDTQKVVDIFESSTRNEYYQLVDGDDMIIWYYDLEGKPIMYQKKGGKMEHLYRIRWQNPGIHLDLHGRPMKYQSPAGSGSPLFIPQAVRDAYKEGRKIKRLYLQEGEKKAVKACKHGIFSVGIMGIQNISYNGKLPYELQLIIKRCGVEEVLFILDSDWDHLNSTLTSGMKVDQRPWNFFHAVKNYREYFKTFTNLGIYLEIYFGYIRAPETSPDNPNLINYKEKGIDDLLSGSLKDKETELFKDIETAINEKDGCGKYIQLHKISTVSDLKLREFWSLHDSDEFAERYKNELIGLSEFQIGKIKFCFKEGKKVPTQPL
ncbi:MAG: CHC2 zinc finger domain-containing protein, partial [Bacteroidales bacterium]